MNKEILKRYFEGKSSRWEKQQVRDYFEGDDMRVFDDYILEQENKLDKTDIDKGYKDNFLHDLLANINQNETPQPVRSRRYSFLKIAAGFLLFALIGSAFFLIRIQQENVSKTPEYTIISNQEKNLKQLRLTDGTKVWLNTGSVLTFDKRHYGKRSREVTIKGEVYFDVSHNPEKPFKVHSGKLTTQVLGTAFNVEAYENEENVRVLLVRGYVRIRSGNTEKALLPGQMLEYNIKKEDMKISPVDVSDKQQLFTSGKIIFENVPLKRAVSRLEEVFDINISIKTPEILSDKTITGSWFRQDTEETIGRILFIHGLKLKKKGEKDYVIED